MSPGEGMGAGGRILGPSGAELRAWKGMLVHRTGGVLGWGWRWDPRGERSAVSVRRVKRSEEGLKKQRIWSGEESWELASCLQIQKCR